MSETGTHVHDCGHRCGCAMPDDPLCTAEAALAAPSDDERRRIERARWPLHEVQFFPEANVSPTSATVPVDGAAMNVRELAMTPNAAATAPLQWEPTLVQMDQDGVWVEVAALVTRRGDEPPRRESLRKRINEQPPGGIWVLNIEGLLDAISETARQLRSSLECHHIDGIETGYRSGRGRW